MKDYNLINTRCIRIACENLGLSHIFHDEHKNFIEIKINNKNYFFVNHSTPFNNGSISKICRDKDFSYKLLKDIIRIPKHISFLDPNYIDPTIVPPIEQVETKDISYITEEIITNFNFPVIVKMNSGSMGKKVFLCKNKEDISSAISIIFEKESPNYDYIAVAQEYIHIQKEYRVIVFREEILLVYEKDISHAIYSGNISPFHYENAKAIIIDDVNLIEKIHLFIQPIFTKIDIEYTGLDIVLTQDNTFVLLELNSRPGFAHLVKDNGEESLIHMYEKILKKLI